MRRRMKKDHDLDPEVAHDLVSEAVSRRPLLVLELPLLLLTSFANTVVKMRSVEDKNIDQTPGHTLNRPALAHVLEPVQI